MKPIKLKSGTELPIMDLKGKAYLQVAYRLVWFREEHPNWSIQTEFIFQNEKSALAKATIRDDHGNIIATAHKEESLDDFKMGYREKAETGAIGRALGLCGYGTQYEPEFDEGTRLADSPLAVPNPIYMDQPDGGDAVISDVYRITFGQYKARSLEEVGIEKLKSYIGYLENKASKDNKPIQGQVKTFIDMASDYIASWENAPQ